MTKDAVAGRIRRLLALADRYARHTGIPDTTAALTPDMLDQPWPPGPGLGPGTGGRLQRLNSCPPQRLTLAV